VARGKEEKSTTSHGAQATKHEEQWIDGPRISKQKVAEARNILLKEHIKKETWIDGPMQKPVKTAALVSYGFMDNHKKSMIRKWVENQTVQLKQSSPVKGDASGILRSSEPVEEIVKEEVKEMGDGAVVPVHKESIEVARAVVRPTETCFKNLQDAKEGNGVCGGSSESSEEEKFPPPPLPLILRYGSEPKMGKYSILIIEKSLCS